MNRQTETNRTGELGKASPRSAGITLAKGRTMLFQQLFDLQSSTYSYLLADFETREAVLIDPVLEQSARDVQIIRELGLKLLMTLETHVHADHVTASGLLRTQLGAHSVFSAHAEVGCADRKVVDGEAIHFGRHALEVRATPGHTRCSISFVEHAQRRVFTGDALLIRGCGRTDFQHGDAGQLYDAIHDQLFSLPDDYAVYPGHDYKGRTVSSIGEETQLNPRLGGGKTRADFIETMNSLELPRPKLIDVAVPANQKCGFEQLEGEGLGWAPLARTPDGIPEVGVEWVQAHRGGFDVVDVREPHELSGDLGRLKDIRSVPQDRLAEASTPWDRDRAIVVVCRSGGRSGRAAKLLEDQGFRRVASMAGGMLRWREAQLPLG